MRSFTSILIVAVISLVIMATSTDAAKRKGFKAWRGIMKSIIVLLFVVAVVFAEKYNSKYDNVDVDGILQNNRILTSYIKCILETGACTAEGRELKKTLPDALVTGCAKCNDKQKVTAEKVIKHLKKNKPREWDQLIKKYDPEGKYQQRYDEHKVSHA
ncbi:ejaculatory bulb-specific protein 3-like [Leptopilina boulardi]|uniref:ejaculatory bulb-specific protein 3-like n=1 Tax=Leptopilina boulardi TaxID=63433 RepID=UPI0021F66C6B|nr:ejaculatory bulb-specific protein 3-like [Leptopilina boulardi]